MCQVSAMHRANNRSSCIDRRSVIQSELEEVRKKRLTKSWVQRHVVNDFQTSVSASKSNFTISLDAWQSHQKTLHQESKRRQKDAKLKLHNYKRGLEAWPSQSTQQLLPNTTKPSSPQDETLKNKALPPTTRTNNKPNARASTPTNIKPSPTVLPNYSLLIDWQLRLRNMAKQERRRRSDATQILRQFKTNQDAIVCPCPQPNKTARNKLQRATTAADAVAAITRPIINTVLSRTKTAPREVAPLNKGGYVKSLTKKYERRTICASSYDDDECLSHGTKDTSLMDSDDEFYDSCDDNVIDKIESDEQVIESTKYEVEETCEQAHEPERNEKAILLESFLREMNFMNGDDEFQKYYLPEMPEENTPETRTVFDCFFPWLAQF
eukprot:CAMPEP_0172489994 /NCGR_PEP_ID=MMETSP1066-20121228/20295_1 /TAXON_ID=671091 /ORGANISM="Coscinodiscus wailesii, Strain CCMP2513" /LENGTH=380 /DNA_ID=CAMNT_0013258249 /DNA_START=150 /DNA_END=1292 /DNA_ORIENTATION=-